MNSIQESTNELNAAIRYAENAIASANQTIESMQFRQDMAKKQYTEQTGREQALERELADLKERLKMETAAVERLRKDTPSLRDENERLKRDVEFYTKEYNELVKQKEASSGPCGCQAYRDLEERATMPVIPKAVAVAIFREGVQHGVEAACTELDNAADISIEENEYCGDFEVSFSKYIDLSDHVDTDWMRGKCGDYSEESVIDALSTLCEDSKFECRIHGVDDNTTNND